MKKRPKTGTILKRILERNIERLSPFHRICIVKTSRRFRTFLKENVAESDELIEEIAKDDAIKTNLKHEHIMELTPLRRRNLVRYYVRSKLGNLPPTSQFNEFMRQLERATTETNPKMVVGNRTIGLKNKSLYCD